MIRKEKRTINMKNIKLIIYDFDGVMTDNRVILREDGLESVIVNRSDGLAIEIIKNIGIKQIIITKEKNKVVDARAKKLGIPLIKGINNKKQVLENYCKKNNIFLKSVVYIGNDINDLEAMRAVGHPLCPSDAYEEVKNISKIILDAQGGAGVIRDLLRFIKQERAYNVGEIQNE